MHAAVTGATGFVGKHLIDALLQRGDRVSCLVRSRRRGAPLEARGCRLVEGDLEGAAALSDLLSDAEVVYHVAGLVQARHEAEFDRVNRGGTERLLDAARRAQLRRVVYVSSLAAAGPAIPGRPVADEEAARPVTPYGRSKLAGEAATRSSGLPFTILRPASVYGPDDVAFLRVFRMARLGFVPVLGDGKQELSFVHVDDLARALLPAGTSAACLGRTYYVSGPEVLTQREFVQAVGRATGHAVRVVTIPGPLARVTLRIVGTAARFANVATQISHHKTEEFLAAAWTCTSAALQRDTGWRAETPLDRGLAETAAWYRQAGWLR